MAAPIVRRIEESPGDNTTTVPIQAIAPSTSPGRFGLRPRNTRAAFQTIPQAMKPTAFSASDTVSPSLAPTMVQIATEAAPSRYAVPHHFSAGIFSCLPKNISIAPSLPRGNVARLDGVEVLNDMSSPQ